MELDDPPTLRQLAQILDRILNHKSPRHPRREGFILLRFKHNELIRPNYIATCPNDESIKLLKLLLAQLEGRITGEEGHAD